MQPGVELLGQVGQVGERIEVAGVGLARGRDQHRRRAVELAEATSHRSQVDPADVVADEDLDGVLAVAEHLQGLAGAGVHVPAGQHRHPGQAGQPGRGHVDAVPLGPPVRGQRQTGEVGEGGARGQRAAPARWQADELAQPVQRDRLHRVGQPRRGAYECVLVEQGHDPVGGQRCRGRAADHEMEEPRPGRCGRGRRPDPQQSLDGRPGAEPCSGSGPPSSPSSGSAARSYTSRSGNPSRYGPAASTTWLQRGQRLGLFVEWIAHVTTPPRTHDISVWIISQAGRARSGSIRERQGFSRIGL